MIKSLPGLVPGQAINGGDGSFTTLTVTGADNADTFRVKSATSTLRVKGTTSGIEASATNAAENAFATYITNSTITTIRTNGTTEAARFGLAQNATFAKPIFLTQAAPAAKTTSTTLTAAEILAGLITGVQGAAGNANYTLPDGSAIQTALPTDFATNDSFTFSVINISTVLAETITLVAGSGTSIVGGVGIPANSALGAASSASFRVRKSAANTFITYRLG